MPCVPPGYDKCRRNGRVGRKTGHRGQWSQSPNNHLLGNYVWRLGYSSHSQITKSLNNNKAAFLSLLLIPSDSFFCPAVSLIRWMASLYLKILSSLIYNFKAVSWPSFLAGSQQSEYHILWNHLQSTLPNQNILKPNSVGWHMKESSLASRGRAVRSRQPIVFFLYLTSYPVCLPHSKPLFLHS